MESKSETPNNEELESNMFLSDLNMLVVMITQLYSSIFDAVQLRRMHARKNLLSARSWVELFISMERNKDTRKEVLSVMETFNLNEEDLKKLQKIRRVRNELCHPKTTLNEIDDLLEKNWKEHEAFMSLKRVVATLRVENESCAESEKEK